MSDYNYVKMVQKHIIINHICINFVLLRNENYVVADTKGERYLGVQFSEKFVNYADSIGLLCIEWL